MYQHLAHTLEGLWTIRAFQGEERFTRHFDVFMDRHTAAAYTYLAVGRWFALRLDLLTVLLLGLLAVVAVAVRESELYQFITERKYGEGSIGGWEYSCCNTSLLSMYETIASYLLRNRYSWVVKVIRNK